MTMAKQGIIARARQATPDALAGALRMAGTVGADVVRAADVLGVLNGGPPDDPLAARDPEYIRRTLPTLRLFSDRYFRAEVRGLDHIPAEGPVLLVGNHSGGILIADTFVFGQHFYDHFGPERRFHQLAHDLVFTIPGMRASLARYGTVPASPRNMERALERDAALLVYPGGDHETYRPSWESSEIDFAGRTGFVELALKLGVQVVPVVAIGGQETALFLGQGRRFAKAVGIDRMLRVKVLPAQIAPPLGVTVLDLPGRIPLPSKITIQVLPPIDLREQLGDDKPETEDAYRFVTATMQSSLDGLATERTLPVVG
jgi:1-acyl-sn-glycerol-3-phosphate acyltransferase